MLISRGVLEDYLMPRKEWLSRWKKLAADRTYLQSNISKYSWIAIEVETELSMQSYLDCLDVELSKQSSFKRHSVKTPRKRCITRKTHPDSGYINHGKRAGSIT